MRNAVICACVKILPRNLGAPLNFSVEKWEFCGNLYAKRKKPHGVQNHNMLRTTLRIRLN